MRHTALVGAAFCSFICLLIVSVPADAVPTPEKGTVEVPADHGQRRSKKTLKLHYERYRHKGTSKRPLILLHGGPGGPIPIAAVLRSPFGEALLRHYDVLYFDQRGAGRSLVKQEKRRGYVIRNRHHYRVRQYVEDLDLVRRKVFGKKKVTLVGSSWGGFLGLAYAVAHPDAVEGLILGSFSATGRYANQICSTIDRTLLSAEASQPGLRRALASFRRAVAASRVIWRRGTKEQRPLRPADMVEVVLPLMVKARYRLLSGLLRSIVKGGPKGIKFLDRLDLDKGEMASAGGSLPGEATFCQAFIEEKVLRNVVAHPSATTTTCDSRQVARAMLKLCRPYLTRRHQVYDVTGKLGTVKVPALIFAGKWDPVLEWQATLRLALGLPHATFVLIDGGHTPIRAGGKCLARAIDAFARNKKNEIGLGCFVASWP